MMGEGKDGRYYRMIRSRRWTELRTRKLTASPLCEMCLSAGLYVSATEVHHVTPCETAQSDSEMERLMFSWTNLMSLCHDCHVGEHVRLRSHSRSARQERQRSRTQRFIGRYLDGGKCRKEGEAFFYSAPLAPNPLPQSRDKNYGLENSVGGKTPTGKTYRDESQDTEI